MKLAVIQCVNGNYSVVAEGFTDPEKAIVKHLTVAANLHNAADVETAYVCILDEQLNCYQGYRERIDHTAAPTEPAEE